jgi:hypothetical protein
MSGKLERSASVVGLLVLIASLHLAISLAGDIASLLGSAVLAVVGTLLWLHFELPHRRSWAVSLLLSSAILASAVVLAFGSGNDFWRWLALPVAFTSSFITLLLLIRDRARCNLCNQRLKLQAVTFRCPRCTMLVCDERCWNFEHRRCAMCLENRVPVLPIQDSWWNRIAGSRSPNGRCQVCLASSEQADLRPCGKCRRLQCRDCWDFRNGECARCDATLAELPVSLREMVAETEGERQPFAYNEASKG